MHSFAGTVHIYARKKQGHQKIKETVRKHHKYVNRDRVTELAALPEQDSR